ncbi:TPA: hypothetical protein EYN98_03760 [Candidatus Poribacteria bacterium]|jgi:hypothetical protein|nr:hypothetical protein [Candidatus Poribacteria bacterium]HIB86124.1 hypothetical protein [Candidatus Poribacteria bacterium]
MTLNEVFDICKDLELRHAKLYANLSLILGELDERAAVFWENMSTQEWHHFIMVDFGRSVCEKTMDLDQTVEGLPDLQLDQIFEILNRNEDRIFKEELGLKDGFEMAIELEGTESDSLYIYLTSVIKHSVDERNQPYLMDRLKRIEKEMTSHHIGLIEATKRLSRDPELVRRANTLLHH